MKTALHDDHILCGNTSICYRYCHSRRRRTVGIVVRPDLTITVRAPYGTSRETIRDFVERRAAWIAKALTSFEDYIPKPGQSWRHGAKLQIQGVECRLLLEEGLKASVALRDNELIVTTPGDPAPDCVQKIVGAWLRNRAATLFRERAIVCHQLMRTTGIPLPPIAIRAMKSRWGSYSYRTQRIALNLNLIKAPVACLDYVIIHELCHIKVRHHGPDFWELVGRFAPDYAEQRKQLRLCAIDQI